MIRLKTLALLFGLAALHALGAAPVLAETPAKAPAGTTTSATKADSAKDSTKTDAAKTDAAKPDADDAKDGDPKMSDADKRAKAIECSKQADAKKLHGEARKKFRSSCKRGK